MLSDRKSLQQELHRLRIEEKLDTQNNEVTAGIAHLDARITNRQELKVAQASIVARRQSLDARTDCALPLRRFLDELPPADHPWSEMDDIQDILTLNEM